MEEVATGDGGDVCRERQHKPDVEESRGGMPCNPVLRWDQNVELGPLRTYTVSSSLASWEEVL